MDNGYSSNEEYGDEKLFVDEIEICLKENGCQTWREVCPDGNGRLRVDLIFYRDDFGFVGVECKNGNTLRQGSKFSDAIDQIGKYRKWSYLKGNLIDRWCIGVPIKSVGSKEGEREILIFIRSFLKSRYNINLLEYGKESRWKRAYCKVGAMFPNSIIIGGKEW